MSRQAKQKGAVKGKFILVIAVILIIVIAIIVINNNKKKDEKQTSNIADSTEVQNEETIEEKYTETVEDGTKINTSGDLKQTKTYNGLEISNVTYTLKGGITTLLADVKNTNKKTHELENIKIIILDENNEEITTIAGVIGKIEAGQTIQLNANITGDVLNAKDIKIEPQR